MPVPSFGKLFSPSQLTATAATIYTLPASPPTNFIGNGRVRFTNTATATAHQVTAYVVPAAGTAGAANCILNAESIAANSHLDVDLPQMGPGDFFVAFGDALSTITVHCLLGTIIS